MSRTQETILLDGVPTRPLQERMITLGNPTMGKVAGSASPPPLQLISSLDRTKCRRIVGRGPQPPLACSRWWHCKGPLLGSSRCVPAHTWLQRSLASQAQHRRLPRGTTSSEGSGRLPRRRRQVWAALMCCRDNQGLAARCRGNARQGEGSDRQMVQGGGILRDGAGAVRCRLKVGVALAFELDCN